MHQEHPRNTHLSGEPASHLLQVFTQVSPEDAAFPGHLFKVPLSLSLSLSLSHTHTSLSIAYPPSFPALFLSIVPTTFNILFLASFFK